ncbi:hypothetical protein U9M48_030452 [Paspalum notatum var. saurae]|uniref:Uncharacterized protein n=1 Tax=Paspalum notatum var. saurae TaxID=547442 RepID=A0AAQ3X394_PASNO
MMFCSLSATATRIYP